MPRSAAFARPACCLPPQPDCVKSPMRPVSRCVNTYPATIADALAITPLSTLYAKCWNCIASLLLHRPEMGITMNTIVKEEPPKVVRDDKHQYVGSSVNRPNMRRHLEGRGCFVDDISLPRLAHVVYLRSPYAHARFKIVDVSRAKAMPGIVAIVAGPEIASICTPWVATLAHLEGMKSPPEYPLALDRACWQGEPVLAIVALTRHQAEDALPFVDIDWQELPVVDNMETALSPETPVIHPELGD